MNKDQRDKSAKENGFVLASGKANEQRDELLRGLASLSKCLHNFRKNINTAIVELKGFKRYLK